MKISERVNLGIADLERDLPFLAQLGITELGIMIRDWEPWFGTEQKWHDTPGARLRTSDYYELDDLVALKEWIAGYGIKLYSIMGLNLYRGPRTRPGQPEHETFLRNIERSIRNMGKAGIPQFAGGSRGFAGLSVKTPFGLNHWRTSVEKGRGGAKVVRYNHAAASSASPVPEAPVDVEEVWADTQYFLDRIGPVAEESGVWLCHHPADPPVAELRGIGRILCNQSDFDRLLAMGGDSSKVIFCFGCFAQMTDADGVYDAIRHFGDKIIEVHFRNVVGGLHDFVEVYPDEGKLDMVRAIATLKEVGFYGQIAIDHTPKGIDDTSWGHRGRAYAIGYLKGLLQSAGALG